MLKLFLEDLKMMVRNRQALFWSFMFPLMFTFIFGFFFGKETKAGTIALINHSDSELSATIEKGLNDSGLFTINKETDLQAQKQQLSKSKIAAIVEIPEKFGERTPDAPTKILLYYDPANTQPNAVITGFLDKFLTNINYSVQNAKPIYSIDQINVVGSARTLTYFDFVLAGILGLSLMNSSIIGIAVGLAKYREDKILKRITVTPIKTWWFIGGEVLSRIVLNFFQIGIILAVGKFVFDAHIYGNIFTIFAMAILGAILFQLIGFAIASFAKTTDAAQGMATALTIPMMFLTGVFFPIDSLPKWLYSIVQYLPLAPLLRILRNVVLEAKSPFENPMNIGIVFSWIALCLVVSIYKFRLSEE